MTNYERLTTNVERATNYELEATKYEVWKACEGRGKNIYQCSVLVVIVTLVHWNSLGHC